jgi:hypothetical protein
MNAQIPVPPLYIGNYVNDSLATHTYTFPGNCNPNYDVDIKLNNFLIPLVSEVRLIFVVTHLSTIPGSVTTTSGGIVQLGDTFIFSATTNYYRFSSTSAGVMKLKLIMEGTPIVSGEQYPCELVFQSTLTPCLNTNQLSPWPPGGICTVGNISNVNNNFIDDNVFLYPNPTRGYLKLRLQTPHFENLRFTLYSSVGNVALDETLPFHSTIESNYDLDFEDGIYYWKISSTNGYIRTGKLIIISN